MRWSARDGTAIPFSRFSMCTWESLTARLSKIFENGIETSGLSTPLRKHPTTFYALLNEETVLNRGLRRSLLNYLPWVHARIPLPKCLQQLVVQHLRPHL